LFPGKPYTPLRINEERLPEALLTEPVWVAEPRRQRFIRYCGNKKASQDEISEDRTFFPATGDIDNLPLRRNFAVMLRSPRNAD